jgi:hypothetical protein
VNFPSGKFTAGNEITPRYKYKTREPQRRRAAKESIVRILCVSASLRLCVGICALASYVRFSFHAVLRTAGNDLSSHVGSAAEAVGAIHGTGVVSMAMG